MSDAERVWDMMKTISICMLANWNGHELHARPMGAYVRPQEEAIFFLTDLRRHKDDEIAEFPQVCAAFADTSGQKYVSVSGRAEISNDRAKIRELWSTPAKAWWDSPDDPNIRVLKLTPYEAEYWDSPGTVVSYVKMAAAAVTGKRPDMGDNRKVAM
ncbi:MAG: pyridoxamine 5'-phosphate oxidase family protein [Pseudorhodoplanes sp.]